MAEGLARLIARERSLDCRFSSAGVIARDGHPASTYGVDILREKGVDIAGHRARRLRGEIIAEADLVVAMEEEHRLAIRDFPEAALSPVLLLSEWAGEAPLGPGIDDPIGGDRQDYERTAEEIEAYIRRALERL